VKRGENEVRNIATTTMVEVKSALYFIRFRIIFENLTQNNHLNLETAQISYFLIFCLSNKYLPNDN